MRDRPEASATMGLLSGVGVDNRLAAVDPGRIDHIAKHGCSSGQAISCEFAGFGGSCPVESTILFQLVNLLNVGLAVA